MSGKLNRTNKLKIAWIVTAFAAIVVLIVYFIKLNGLYREQQAAQLERQTLAEAEKKNGTGNDGKASEANLTDGSDKTQGPEGLGVTPEPDKTQGPAGGDVTPSPEGTGTDSGTEVTQAPDETQGAEGVDVTPTPDETQNPDGGEATQTPEDAEGNTSDPEAAGNSPENEKYHGVDPTKPMVALSFDDGPSIYTERILKKLKEYNGHATFFMVGECIDRYPELVRLVNDYGCEIGNHTLNHKTLTKLSKSEIIEDLTANQQKINTALGFETKCIVRPPGGSYNDTVKNNAGMPLVCWSVDSEDWKSRNADTVFEKVKKEVFDGCIILCHDLYESTADAADRLIPWLSEQGYQICTITDMYSSRGEFQAAGHVYRHTMTAEEYIASLAQAGQTEGQ